MTSKIWMVRAGRGSAFVYDFIRHGMIAVGWPELGQIEPGTPKSEIEKHFRHVNSSASNGQVQNAVSQLIRFLNDLDIGDTVITYDKNKGRFYIGKIVSAPMWAPDHIAELPRIRRVTWQHYAFRERLSPASRYSLGSIQTLFQVRPDVATDLRNNALPLQGSVQAE